MKSTPFTFPFVLIALAVAPSVRAQTPTDWKFSFASGPAPAGYTAVAPTAVYSADTGFGFELGANLTSFANSGNTATLPGGVASDQPFLFSVALPEGNYKVTVTLGSPSSPSNTTVKAESRRLMLLNVPVPAGQTVTRSFIVNVRTPALPPVPRNAPGGSQVRLDQFDDVGFLDWDEKLTLEFNGYRPALDSLTITKVDNVPTVFLAGDSTVTDQSGEPTTTWGQDLPLFFQPTVAFANHAQSGETLKTFLTALRLDKILSQIKPGDYLFMQFCHNDEKANWPQSYVAPDSTYPAYLKTYIAEVRRRGATPVLVTAMQRVNFDASGKVTNSHDGYPDAVRKVAQEEGVALIDLEKMSRAFYESVGPGNATAISRDRTHSVTYGGYELAKCVVLGIQQAKLPLAQFIVPGFPAFDPASPDALSSVIVPASPPRPAAPRANPGPL